MNPTTPTQPHQSLGKFILYVIVAIIFFIGGYYIGKGNLLAAQSASIYGATTFNPCDKNPTKPCFPGGNLMTSGTVGTSSNGVSVSNNLQSVGPLPTGSAGIMVACGDTHQTGENSCGRSCQTYENNGRPSGSPWTQSGNPVYDNGRMVGCKLFPTQAPSNPTIKTGVSTSVSNQ